MTVMTQAYIIIDMQNDFIDGALGSAQAQAVVPRIEAKIARHGEFERQKEHLIEKVRPFEVYDDRSVRD